MCKGDNGFQISFSQAGNSPRKGNGKMFLIVKGVGMKKALLTFVRDKILSGAHSISRSPFLKVCGSFESS